MLDVSASELPIVIEDAPAAYAQEKLQERAGPGISKHRSDAGKRPTGLAPDWIVDGAAPEFFCIPPRPTKTFCSSAVEKIVRISWQTGRISGFAKIGTIQLSEGRERLIRVKNLCSVLACAAFVIMRLP